MGNERRRLYVTTLLVAGVVLLIFTFVTAFVLLMLGSSIPASPSLSEALGEILGPLAEALIKVLFLGIMGWIGSILTIRGIQLTRESDEINQKTQ